MDGGAAEVHAASVAESKQSWRVPVGLWSFAFSTAGMTIPLKDCSSILHIPFTTYIISINQWRTSSWPFHCTKRLFSQDYDCLHWIYSNCTSTSLVHIFILCSSLSIRYHVGCRLSTRLSISPLPSVFKRPSPGGRTKRCIPVRLSVSLSVRPVPPIYSI